MQSYLIFSLKLHWNQSKSSLEFSGVLLANIVGNELSSESSVNKSQELVEKWQESRAKASAFSVSFWYSRLNARKMKTEVINVSQQSISNLFWFRWTDVFQWLSFCYPFIFSFSLPPLKCPRLQSNLPEGMFSSSQHFLLFRRNKYMYLDKISLPFKYHAKAFICHVASGHSY